MSGSGCPSELAPNYRIRVHVGEKICDGNGLLIEHFPHRVGGGGAGVAFCDVATRARNLSTVSPRAAALL